MADPISISSGLLALVGFALQSSKTLYHVVESFQNSRRSIRELKEELDALGVVLQSLEEATANDNADLNAVKLPLLRCGKACQDFEAMIIKCTTHSGGARTSFRDWAKLMYMGEDVDGFKHMLAGYKSTIFIALGDATIRKATVTAEVLNQYKGMIQNTTSDLEEHLQKIDEKLQSLSLEWVRISSEDEAERQQIEEERESTRQCLGICAQVSAHIDELQPNNVFWLETGEPAPAIAHDKDLDDASNEHTYAYRQLYGILDTEIVGMQFYHGRATVGERAVVRREPGNLYDRNGIRVENVQRVQVGYIRRQIAAKLAPLMDDGSLMVEGVFVGETSASKCPISLKFFGWDPRKNAVGKVEHLELQILEASLQVNELVRDENEMKEHRETKEKATTRMRSASNQVTETRSEVSDTVSESVRDRNRRGNINDVPARSETYFEYTGSDSSIANALKVYVESILGQQLLWWPLKEPFRPQTLGMRRFAWKCDCGSPVYFDVPTQQETIETTSGRSQIDPGSFTQVGNSQSLPLHNLSSIHVQPVASSSQQIQLTQVSGSSTTSPNQASSSIARSPSGKQNPTSQVNGEFIYWCIHENNNYAQAIEIDAIPLTDYSFMTRLLSEYARVTGWWSQCWTMTNCRGAKFTKFRYLYDAGNLVNCTKSELPENAQYHYAKQVPLEEYRRCLEARIEHYLQDHVRVIRWPWSRDCFSSMTLTANPTALLQCIPKKVPERLKPKVFKEGYGMQAVASLAVIKIVVMFLIWQCGSVAFLIYWLYFHNGDLQNAFIVLTTTLAGFVIYLEILTRFRNK